jgi:hypothetical protein
MDRLWLCRSSSFLPVPDGSFILAVSANTFLKRVAMDWASRQVADLGLEYDPNHDVSHILLIFQLVFASARGHGKG